MIFTHNKKENKKSATGFVDCSQIVDIKQIQNKAQGQNLNLPDSVGSVSCDLDMRKAFSHTAHEIRNPIAAMELHSRAILKRIEMGEAENAKPSLECIQNSLQVLKNIADGLSSYSREVQISKQKASLGLLIGNVVEIMRPAFDEKGVMLSCDDVKNIFIEIDVNKTQQVLINLLKNALEATECGGKVSVWFENTEKICNKEICICVGDTGHGVSDRNKDRIFYPNFTTKQTGSGIGLFESRRIARAQQGDITLLKTDKYGSVFGLKLPA